MNILSNEKLASVLDAVADYIDEAESTKLAAETAARDERIAKIALSYESSTGETIPDNLKTKLASLDQDTLDHLLKVAKYSNESPAALGRPADLSDHPAPRTVKEAADRSEQRFLDWIVNE